MALKDTTKAVTIGGIVCNGLLLFVQFLLALEFFPTYFVLTVIWFFVGIVFPLIVYNYLPKGNRFVAGGLIIVSA